MLQLEEQDTKEERQLTPMRRQETTHRADYKARRNQRRNGRLPQGMQQATKPREPNPFCFASPSWPRRIKMRQRTCHQLDEVQEHDRLEDRHAYRERERDRERIIEWCLKEAGISKRLWPGERDFISPQSHINPAQQRVRKKLLEWQKEKYQDGIPEWSSQEEEQTL